MAADGMRNDEIAAQLQCGRDVVSQWRKRFFEHQRPASGTRLERLRRRRPRRRRRGRVVVRGLPARRGHGRPNPHTHAPYAGGDPGTTGQRRPAKNGDASCRSRWPLARHGVPAPRSPRWCCSARWRSRPPLRSPRSRAHRSAEGSASPAHRASGRQWRSPTRSSRAGQTARSESRSTAKRCPTPSTASRTSRCSRAASGSLRSAPPADLRRARRLPTDVTGTSSVRTAQAGSTARPHRFSSESGPISANLAPRAADGAASNRRLGLAAALIWAARVTSGGSASAASAAMTISIMLPFA